METATKEWKPDETLTNLDVAFPATVRHLMPEYADIPEEFRDFNSRNKWNRFQTDWFYRGVPGLEVTPKNGIDAQQALRHLACIQGSYEPKHEHKEAAVAYLASLWFEDVKYDRAK